ncbi:hypothetical protein MASR1M36_17930 [Candidatus Cloacimonadaceae bacterium]
MKKQLFLVLILIFTIALLTAGTARPYTQKCQLDNGTVDTPYVTNTGQTHSPNYVLTVRLVELNESYSTLTLGPTQIRMSRLGNGTTTPYYTGVYFQMANFSAWSAGQHMEVTVQYIGTQEPEDTGTTTSWTLEIPTGTTVWNPALVQTIPPTQAGGDTWTYNLQVNGPDGYAVTGPVNGTTDYLATDNDDDVNELVGDYTIAAAPAGFHWAVNPITVTAGMFVAAKTDYVYNATIEFVLVPDPDVYNYTLNVNGPDGYAVTGPVNGTTDYVAQDNDGTMENALLGAYTIAAAPAGFHWVTNPLTVTADMFTAAKSGAVLGSRNNGAKATYNYVATIEFVLEADVIPDTWTYNLQVNGPDGYAVTGPVNGTTDYLAVDDDDNVNELVGDYTIAAAPAGFHWQTNPITVTADMFVAAKVDHVYNATIEFVLVENVIDPTNPPMGVVVTPGGNNGMPGTDGGLPATIYTIAASGVWDVVVNKPAGFGYPWYAFINTIPMLASGPIMVDTYTFMNVNFGAKAPLVVTLDDDEALTLPVELSYFAATLTAQNFVKLTWVSQSETGLLGYRVYRSENNDQASAISITPSMIPATNTSTTQTYSITDAEVAIGSTYYYWLESVDMGHSTFFGPTSVLVQGEVPPVLPEYTTMRNAYPNPFRANTGTTIEVNVKAGETGQVTVYNVLGQVVKTYTVKEGLNNLNWNGKDSKGNVCGSGIYFYKLSTPSMNMTKKMVIVK